MPGMHGTGRLGQTGVEIAPPDRQDRKRGQAHGGGNSGQADDGFTLQFKSNELAFDSFYGSELGRKEPYSIYDLRYTIYERQVFRREFRELTRI